MIDAILLPFLDATLRTATPLLFAALGELVTERAGLINVGLEGIIIAGCLGGLVAAGAGGPILGFVGGMTAGMVMAALFAWFVVTRRADAIITGTAITLLGLGVTGTAYVALYGDAGAALRTPTIGPIALPLLSGIPWLGPTLFTQSVATYVALLLVPAVAWWLGRTASGLALRAVGERADAAAAAGIPVARMRWGALLFAGAMGGLCGATLVLADVGTFNEGMSAGRGFIAIAIVVLGRWTAIGVAGAALVFGGAFALRSLLQTLGLPLPYQLFLALPYALTLVLLAAQRGRAVAPGELGSGLDR
ncbi:MAG: ABC transporter permease [Gemmatimonadaceae bacterium]